jgi:hypothetical protein
MKAPRYWFDIAMIGLWMLIVKRACLFMLKRLTLTKLSHFKMLRFAAKRLRSATFLHACAKLSGYLSQVYA